MDWQRYMTNFDEGLGTVYERMIMNEMFDRFIKKYSIKNVLEVPVYGMTGITGINSFEFVNQGCSLTIVDNNKERIKDMKRIWSLLNLENNVTFCYVDDFSSLPFGDGSFDLVWNFAALWHLDYAPQLVKEMTRSSSKCVFVSVQNTTQMGHYLRRYVIDKDLFKEVHEEWLNTGLIKNILTQNNMHIVEEGIFDVPPFPDIAMPIGELKKMVGLKQEEKNGNEWNWNIMKYYAGEDPVFREKVERYMFVERSKIPKRIKALWAHHRYVLGIKNKDAN